VTARPWRAVSWMQYDGVRHVVHRAAAKTEAGLAKFREREAAVGFGVTVWQIRPIPEVEQQLAATPPSPSVPSTP